MPRSFFANLFVTVASLTRELAMQPLSLMVRSSVGSSHNSHLKPYDTEQQRKVEGEEEDGGGVVETKTLTSLLPVHLQAIQRGDFTLLVSLGKLFNCLTFLCFHGAGEQFNMF